MIIERMSKDLGLSLEYLSKLAATASHRYKIYTIPKGSGGRRTIHHPARELKLVQGWLVDNILCHLPVHHAATAYQPGSSIQKNAALHSHYNYLLRVDFTTFFPSLTGNDVSEVLRGSRALEGAGELTNADIQFVTAVVCRRGALTIGAPSSPILSNAIMFPFDEYWSTYARQKGIAYSRYADDLYFSTSTPHTLDALLRALKKYLRSQQTPRLRINSRKTVFTSRKHLRKVTGLVLTPDRKISIGRDKKRFLRGMVFKLLSKHLDIKAVKQLEGWVAYVGSVEPTFVSSLERKYSVNIMRELKLAKDVLGEVEQ